MGAGASSALPSLSRSGVWHHLCWMIPLAVMTADLLAAPFTKVEESFNMQAMHDLLYAPTIHDYDHQQFPGIVPRTFVGACVVAGLASPFVRVIDWWRLNGDAVTEKGPTTSLPALRRLVPGDGGHTTQTASVVADVFAASLICRMILGVLVAASIAYLGWGLDAVVAQKHRRRGGISKAAGQSSDTQLASDDAGPEHDDDSLREREALADGTLSSSAWLGLLLACCSPHTMYYATRPLPNTYALVALNVAVGCFFRGHAYPALAVLGVAIAIVRGDLLVFVAPFGLLLVATRWVTLFNGLLVGIASVLLGILVSVAVDSYFWQRWIWPEGVVLLFNTVQNKSHEWGTEPPLWYFLSALPRGLSAAACLSVLGLIYDVVVRRGWSGSLLVSRRGAGRRGVVARSRGGVGMLPSSVKLIATSGFAFVALFSYLPHKELRFIMPVFPALCVPAAAWMAWITSTRRPPSPAAGLSDAGLDMAAAGAPRRGASLFTAQHAALLIVSGLLAGSAAFHALMVTANAAGYPGGEALMALQRSKTLQQRLLNTSSLLASRDHPGTHDGRSPREDEEEEVTTIFLDAYAGMTGVSRFLKLRRIVYQRRGCKPPRQGEEGDEGGGASSMSAARLLPWRLWTTVTRAVWDHLPLLGGDDDRFHVMQPRRRDDEHGPPRLVDRTDCEHVDAASPPPVIYCKDPIIYNVTRWRAMVIRTTDQAPEQGEGVPRSRAAASCSLSSAHDQESVSATAHSSFKPLLPHSPLSQVEGPRGNATWWRRLVLRKSRVIEARVRRLGATQEREDGISRNDDSGLPELSDSLVDGDGLFPLFDAAIVRVEDVHMLAGSVGGGSEDSNTLAALIHRCFPASHGLVRPPKSDSNFGSTQHTDFARTLRHFPLMRLRSGTEQPEAASEGQHPSSWDAGDGRFGMVQGVNYRLLASPRELIHWAKEHLAFWRSPSASSSCRRGQPPSDAGRGVDLAHCLVLRKPFVEVLIAPPPSALPLPPRRSN